MGALHNVIRAIVLITNVFEPFPKVLLLYIFFDVIMTLQFFQRDPPLNFAHREPQEAGNIPMLIHLESIYLPSSTISKINIAAFCVYCTGP